MNKLILLLVASVLLFPVTLSAKEINQSEPSPQNGGERWIGYTDQAYGFSMHLPQSWNSHEAILDQIGSFSQFQTQLQEPPTADLHSMTSGQITIDIGVYAYDKPSNVVIDQWLAADPDQEVNLPSQYFTNLGSNRVLRQDFGSGSQSGDLFLMPTENNKVYFLSVTPLGAVEQDTVAKILTSFRITQPLTRDQPSPMTLRSVSNAKQPRPGTSNPTDKDATSAPSGYRLPFVGHSIITTGPG